MHYRQMLASGLVLAMLGPSPASAASAPDRGTAFTPRPQSQPLYGTKDPSEDPERQQHFVEGHDGTDLYVETWLPAPKKGRKPPKRVPTILIMTPYVSQGQEAIGPSGDIPSFVDYFTARGYAVAQHHVRGTGESGGCLEQTSANQIDDGARVIEYLGAEADWSNGRVGMYGASYDAETQISTAGLGDRDRIKYLKAIIPTASVGGQYDWNFMDGVPWQGQPLIGNAGYLASVSLTPGERPAPQHYPEKLLCQGEVMASSADLNGDFTEYWQAREYRPGAPKVRAATLFVHGLRDFNVQPITIAGFFDRLSDKTPHKGLFGVWNHAFPHAHNSVEPTWVRSDWYAMATAWYDRYLKGLNTGVARWPDVQVQSSDGQWWAVEEYPTSGGPIGHLALGPDGKLGVGSPKGASTYTEQPSSDDSAGPREVVFETAKMKAPLHITGQPALDLWLTTTASDGHVGASLEVVDGQGNVVMHEGGYADAATYGVRSLQHLDPIRGWFRQEQSEPVPTGEPVRALIRFLPTDLLVPKGGRLRLTVGSQVSYAKGTSMASGAVATVEILHDCDHVSALRFLMPQPKAKLLNVRETDEPEKKKLTSAPAIVGRRDGAGMATRRICGSGPIAVSTLKRSGV